MTARRVLAVAASVAVGAGSGAGPARAEAGAGARAVDLAVHDVPAPDVGSLQMRAAGGAAAASAAGGAAASAAGAAVGAAAASAGGGAAASPGGAATGATGASAANAGAPPAAAVRRGGRYRALPDSWRDVQERVVFHLNVGYAVDSATTSGDFAKTGVRPEDATGPGGESFVTGRNYLLGDAVLGSRGVLLPSLHTYLSSQFRLDPAGASAFAAVPHVYDAGGGDALWLRSAYAELDGYGGDASPLRHLYVRAGRQFRYGTTRFIAHFDGVTAAYGGADLGYEASGFVGRRVSLYVDDDPGVLAGAGVKLFGDRLAGVPVDVSVDALHYDGATTLVEWAARGRWAGTDVSATLRAVDAGDGAGIGRIGLRVRRGFGRRVYAVVRAEQLRAADVAYDYVSPARGDVVDVADRVRLGFDPVRDAVRVSATAMVQPSRHLELYGFGRVNRASDESTSAFDASYVEAGAAARATLGRSLQAGGQYKLRRTSARDAAQQAGSDFADTAGAAATSFHELSGELRYRAGARATAAAGAYVRIADYETPYARVSGDTTAGGQIDVRYRVGSRARVAVSGEIAQPSPALAAELGVLMSARAVAEVAF